MLAHGFNHLPPEKNDCDIGRIRLSVSTVNRTDELSGITYVTSFRKYGKHSTGPSTYGPCVRTYSKLFSCMSVLTVCSYIAQSNEIHTYGRVSRGSIPRVRRHGLLYLRTVEYDHFSAGWCVILKVATRVWYLYCQIIVFKEINFPVSYEWPYQHLSNMQ